MERRWGEPLVEQTADTPKLPKRKPMGTYPQDHATGSQHRHGAGGPRPQREGSREHSHTTALPACPAGPPREPLCCPNPTQAHRGQETRLSLQLAEEAPTALLLGKQQANEPSALTSASSPRSSTRKFSGRCSEKHTSTPTNQQWRGSHRPLSITTKTTCSAPSTATEAPQDTLTTATGRTHATFR